jgi:hypothetical protein
MWERRIGFLILTNVNVSQDYLSKLAAKQRLTLQRVFFMVICLTAYCGGKNDLIPSYSHR